ncbi:MAG TPA: PspC domain-containing protein [Solirubrobacteraceae bacterium]
MNATADHQANAHDASLAGARAWFAEKGLSRPREGRILAGVVAAYTRRYDLNPLVGRILGVVGIITFTPIAYVVAWILMPADADAETEATPVAAAAA